MKFKLNKIFSMMIFSLLGLACGKKEKITSPSENVRRSVDEYSAEGKEKLYICQPTAGDRQAEYLWVFRDAKTGEGALDVSQVKPNGEHGIQHRGLIRLTRLTVVSEDNVLKLAINSRSSGSYSRDYDRLGAELIRIDTSTLTGEVVDIKGYTSNLGIKCEKSAK